MPVWMKTNWFSHLLNIAPSKHSTQSRIRSSNCNLNKSYKNLKMSEPIVTVTEGTIRGKIAKDYLKGNFYSFLGIPYAKPPIGPLRFKAPVPVDPWEGVHDGTREGPECPSRHLYFAYEVGNEEKCLNLNVFTKELPKEGSTPKPVMFWIHGGGFLYGSNKAEFFGPDYLLSEDIVLVTINYRLGIFGFLSLEDESLGVPGNAGMKDMILALKWVQRNIHNFNGDPNNVTIFGESAGSASTHYLCLSPLSKGLFHKAIAQSGCSLNPWAIGAPNAKYIAKHIGIDETDETKVLEHLKGLPATKLIKLVHKVPDPFKAHAIRPFGPVVEKPSPDAFLTEQPIEILKAGTFNKVPIIFGYTSKEGLLSEVARFIMPEAKALPTTFESEVPFNWSWAKGGEKTKELAEKIGRFYFGDAKLTESNIEKYHVLVTDNQFVHGIQRCVHYHSLQNVPIYLYRMSLDTHMNYFKRVCASKSLPITFLFLMLAHKSGDGYIKNFALKMSKSLVKKSVIGTCHADDLGYLFKSFCSEKIELNSKEHLHVSRFVKLWTNFAATGNPNCEVLGNIEWKPAGNEKNYLEIAEELKVGVAPDVERMQFWDSLLQ